MPHEKHPAPVVSMIAHRMQQFKIMAVLHTDTSSFTKVQHYFRPFARIFAQFSLYSYYQTMHRDKIPSNKYIKQFDIIFNFLVKPACIDRYLNAKLFCYPGSFNGC